MQPEILIAICVAVVIVFALLMGILSRYRKCPSDKILVIYGKVGSDKNGQARSAKCVHGGRHSLCLLSSRISLWT